MLAFYYSLINSGNFSTSTLKDYAVVESQSAGLSVDDTQKVIYTIQQESSFNPNALNRNDNGQGCDSRGLVQIRSCSHATSDIEAYNPIYAVNFLIKNLDKCKTWWKNTCGKYQ